MTLRPRSLVLASLILIFLANQGMEKAGLSAPLLYSYLDDLLAVPIILSIFHIYQVYRKKDHEYVLPVPLLFVAVMGLSFHFEFLLPRYSSAYTSDVWDIGMYSLGALSYHLSMNRKKRSLEY